jgi:hypothetical protein
MFLEGRNAKPFTFTFFLVVIITNILYRELTLSLIVKQV